MVIQSTTESKKFRAPESELGVGVENSQTLELDSGVNIEKKVGFHIPTAYNEMMKQSNFIDGFQHIHYGYSTVFNCISWFTCFKCCNLFVL